MDRPLVSSLAVLLLAVAGLAIPTAGPQLPALLNEFQADQRSMEGAWNLPWSELQASRYTRTADDWQKRLDTLSFDTLDHGDQVDLLLFQNSLRQEKSDLARQAKLLAEMEFLLPFRAAIQKLEADRLLRLPLDPEAAAGALAALPKDLEALKKRIEEIRKAAEKKEKPPADKDAAPLPEITQVLALRAAKATESIRETMEKWFRFYDSFQPDFGWWVRQPHGKVLEAMDVHVKFLKEEVANQKGKPEDPLIGDPIGAAELASAITAEMLPYTTEELIRIGESEFAWCEEQLKSVAAQLGTDAAGAIQKVKSAHVPAGEQDNLVAAEAQRAIDFIKKNQLVTIPPLCEETWRMQMIPPDQQKTMPYAVYGAPSVMVAYAADSMPHEDKLMAMRGNNRHFTRIVTPHELIPGHHLQRFQADRNRPWRKQFYTPFYVEGWALYWEMTLWDRNYADTAEDKVGMLFWRMHRCARIIVSLKFHLGQMTPAEMVDFLVQKVGHEKMGATSEVRRYISGDYGPLYQAGYMLGGLQLKALHAEMVGPGKLTDQTFHDAVLEQNTIPIEMLRIALTKAPLTKDWKTNWRFR